jgi:hypothetical protein
VGHCCGCGVDEGLYLIGECRYRCALCYEKETGAWPFHAPDRAEYFRRTNTPMERGSHMKLCICKLRPDRDRTGDVADALNSVVDHRCPLHGEKAQPGVWGRHKELELVITPAEWDALRVDTPTEEPTA